MNLPMFKYTETCLTQSPTCTPNLTILAVVSTLKLKLHYSFYTGTTVFVIRPSFDGRIMVWRCPSVRPSIRPSARPYVASSTILVGRI